MNPSPAFLQAAAALLTALGAPVTPTGVRLLVAWMWEEKGVTGNPWQWNNPLNTKWAGFGAVNTGVGCTGGDCVKAYPTRAAGVAATAATLAAYPTVVAALRRGDAAQFFSPAGRAELERWASGSPTGDPAYPAAIAALYRAVVLPAGAVRGRPSRPTGTAGVRVLWAGVAVLAGLGAAACVAVAWGPPAWRAWGERLGISSERKEAVS